MNEHMDQHLDPVGFEFPFESPSLYSVHRKFYIPRKQIHLIHLALVTSNFECLIRFINVVE